MIVEHLAVISGGKEKDCSKNVVCVDIPTDCGFFRSSVVGRGNWFGRGDIELVPQDRVCVSLSMTERKGCSCLTFDT